jgi:ligand-binding sensor domain-containing protein
MKIVLSTLFAALACSFAGKGQEFRNFPLKSEGIFIVKAVFIDDNGIKWFGTNRGLLRYNGGTWMYYTEPEHLVSNQVNALTFEQAGEGSELWVGTSRGVTVIAYDVDGITGSTSYTSADGVMGDSITAVAVDSRHNKFFGSAAGITYFHGGTMDSITYDDHKQSLVNAPVNGFKMHNDSLYIAYNGGIGRLISGVDGVTGASRWTSEYGMTPWSGNIRSIEVDPSGNQWFGTDAGAERHIGLNAKENWDVYTTEDGLIHDYVLSITHDGTGGIWFGTVGGASYFQGNEWNSYTVDDGLISDTVYDIAVDADGSVWFATQRGISQLYDTSFIFQYTSVREGQTGSLDLRSHYDSRENAIRLFYHLQHPEKITVSLYSIDGVLFRRWEQLYSTGGHNQLTLPCEGSGGPSLRSGIYLIQLVYSGAYESRKIVIIRR